MNFMVMAFALLGLLDSAEATMKDRAHHQVWTLRSLCSGKFSKQRKGSDWCPGVVMRVYNNINITYQQLASDFLLDIWCGDQLFTSLTL